MVTLCVAFAHILHVYMFHLILMTNNIISLYIHRLVFVMEGLCVLCDVRTEYLYIK